MISYQYVFRKIFINISLRCVDHLRKCQLCIIVYAMQDYFLVFSPFSLSVVVYHITNFGGLQWVLGRNEWGGFRASFGGL